MTPFPLTPVRILIALALAATPLAAPATVGAAPASRSCATGTAPFDVGTVTVTVKSRGERLRTTVAYPATRDGQRATPVCRKSPLVIAGHGSQGDGASAVQLHRYLVERGYVVAAPTFPSGGYDFGGNAEDVSRTISTVLRRSRSADGALAGLVRGSGKVGYIGTSMGGIIGLTLADRDHRDKRIGAIVSKAGTSFGSLDAKGAAPVLMINGDADTTITYESARRAYGDLTRPKGLIRLAGVGHDLNTRGDDILVTSSSLFLDRYLRGRAKATEKIEKAAANSDIASLRKRW